MHPITFAMQNDAKEKKRKENKYIFDIIENRAKQVLLLSIRQNQI